MKLQSVCWLVFTVLLLFVVVAQELPDDGTDASSQRIEGKRQLDMAVVLGAHMLLREDTHTNAVVLTRLSVLRGDADAGGCSWVDSERSLRRFRSAAS